MVPYDNRAFAEMLLSPLCLLPLPFLAFCDPLDCKLGEAMDCV